MLLVVATVGLNALVVSYLMKLSTSQDERLREVLPGGVTVAVLWQLLQWVGGVYVSRVIARADDLNAVFALVLGLFALIYIASVMAVIGLEVNVVLTRQLYPRALLTPFTDSVDLTEADRRAYADYAKAQRHKGFQRVRVSFNPRERGQVPGDAPPSPDGSHAPRDGQRDEDQDVP